MTKIEFFCNICGRSVELSFDENSCYCYITPCDYCLKKARENERTYALGWKEGVANYIKKFQGGTKE